MPMIYEIELLYFTLVTIEAWCSLTKAPEFVTMAWRRPDTASEINRSQFDDRQCTAAVVYVVYWGADNAASSWFQTGTATQSTSAVSTLSSNLAVGCLASVHLTLKAP